jgi:hypothetical protein
LLGTFFQRPHGLAAVMVALMYSQLYVSTRSLLVLQESNQKSNKDLPDFAVGAESCEFPEKKNNERIPIPRMKKKKKKTRKSIKLKWMHLTKGCTVITGMRVYNRVREYISKISC